MLGPTLNIQRGPLGGRGFESFSEDPVLSGLLAGHYTLGLQQEKVAATLKHFVCNDMEHERMGYNVIVTSRALREIYLLPFMIAISIGKPRAVMTAYNKVNGTHVAESKELLQGVLRDEWKFDGLVMSDWYATFPQNRVECLLTCFAAIQVWYIQHHRRHSGRPRPRNARSYSLERRGPIPCCCLKQGHRRRA